MVIKILQNVAIILNGMMVYYCEEHFKKINPNNIQSYSYQECFTFENIWSKYRIFHNCKTDLVPVCLLCEIIVCPK